MNLKGLARLVTQTMRKNNLRKSVTVPKTVFTISDSDGNKKDFTVKARDKSVIYTVDDVEAVLETCIEVLKEIIRNGDSVQVRGFGNLGVKYFKCRKLNNLNGEGVVEVKAKYVPKFTVSKELKECAMVYSSRVADKFNGELPIDDFDVGEIDSEEDDD